MTFIGASLIVLAQSAADNTVLSLKNVQVLYDRAIEAVRDVSLDVPAGAIVALLGSNGAGKSTILKAISGVLEQEDGEIVNGGVHLDGAQISGRSPGEIVRAGLLQVPEARALFATLTVEENLLAVLETLPLTPEQRRDRVEELLAQMGLEGVRYSQAYVLSGGERRRLEIARSLVLSPSFVLLDEPFSGIDPLTVVDIQKIIADLSAAGIGVLVTDHNVRETLAVTNRAYIISDGKILFTGTPGELSTNSEVRRIYLGEGFRLN